MELQVKNLNNFFDEIFSGLKCKNETRSYIISIFSKNKAADFDLSKDSITLTFAQARDKRDFLTFQTLGDWLFFSQSLFPESLKNSSENYYNSIAQLSYYNCYNMIKMWKIYEELADEYVFLTKQVRNVFINNLFNKTKLLSKF